jgi:divalent metal cation (Fe/Co/Zn/Cd) transporter
MMRRRTWTSRDGVPIVDFALLVLLLAAALYANSLTLIGVSIAGSTIALRELLLVSIRRRFDVSGSQNYQYGFGKILQAGNLLIAVVTIVTGFWLAGRTFDLTLTGSGEIFPLGLAFAATANALVLTWNGLLVHAYLEPLDPAARVLQRVRRRLFVVLLAIQVCLTVAVLAKDPVVAFCSDIVAATLVFLFIVVGGVKLSWDCICDLIDHPLDKDREGAIVALLAREGVKPEELADLRTRHCAERIFAELTLRVREAAPMEDACRRIAALRRALETEIEGLDLVIKLQGFEA